MPEVLRTVQDADFGVLKLMRDIDDQGPWLSWQGMVDGPIGRPIGLTFHADDEASAPLSDAARPLVRRRILEEGVIRFEVARRLLDQAKRATKASALPEPTQDSLARSLRLSIVEVLDDGTVTALLDDDTRIFRGSYIVAHFNDDGSLREAELLG